MAAPGWYRSTNFVTHVLPNHNIVVPKKIRLRLAEKLGVPINDLEGCFLHFEIKAIQIKDKEWIELSLTSEKELKKEKQEINDNNRLAD